MRSCIFEARGCVEPLCSVGCNDSACENGVKASVRMPALFPSLPAENQTPQTRKMTEGERERERGKNGERNEETCVDTPT